MPDADLGSAARLALIGAAYGSARRCMAISITRGGVTTAGPAIDQLLFLWCGAGWLNGVQATRTAGPLVLTRSKGFIDQGVKVLPKLIDRWGTAFQRAGCRKRALSTQRCSNSNLTECRSTRKKCLFMIRVAPGIVHDRIRKSK